MRGLCSTSIYPLRPHDKTDAKAANFGKIEGAEPPRFTRKNTNVTLDAEHLLVAVRRGDVDAVECFISDGVVLVNAASSITGRTGLHEACREGHMGMVEELLSRNADISLEDGEGSTPLHDAVSSLQELHKGAICRCLVEAKARVAARDKNNRTVLHLATSSTDEELLGMLLSQAKSEGIGVNMRDNCGRLPIHDAAEVGNAEAIEAFLQNGAEVSQGDDFGMTPLHLASSHGYGVIVKQLLQEGSDPNAADYNKTTALLEAAGGAHRNVMKALLEFDADPNAVDAWQRSSLHRLAAVDTKEAVDPVALLVDAGAKTMLNAQGKKPEQLCLNPRLKGALRRVPMVPKKVAKRVNVATGGCHVSKFKNDDKFKAKYGHILDGYGDHGLP